MKEIVDILDQKLKEIAGGVSPEAAAAMEPAEVKAEIMPLLELASSVGGALKAGLPANPPAAVRESMMTKAQARMQAEGRRYRRRRTVRRLLWRPAAVAGILLVASAGTALAANAAGPDSFLYPLKQDLEQVRGLIAYQPLDRAAVEVGDAGKRLDEIQSMVNKNEPGYVTSLLKNYDSEMADAQRLVDQAARQGANTSAVMNMIKITRARHDALLQEIAGKVPARVRAVIENEMGHQPGNNGRGNSPVQGAAPGTGMPGQTAPAPAPGGMGGGSNGSAAGAGSGAMPVHGSGSGGSQTPAPSRGSQMGQSSGGSPTQSATPSGSQGMENGSSPSSGSGSGGSAGSSLPPHYGMSSGRL
ncbi:MAG: DUF5667 domain-containing protein [Actinobacteria bacterium]|nr:DUF5667 domain-containing protein [Actinomycetota bacterium]